jgi:hypothetical protein
MQTAHTNYSSHAWRMAAIALCGVAGATQAQTVTYLGPYSPWNGSGTISTLTSYTSNLGVAFVTGSSGPFSIDWMNLGLTSTLAASTSISFKVALRDTTNTTPYSAVAGSTELAVDTVTFALPVPSSSAFDLELFAADIPNISAYTMQSSSAYSLIVYNASAALALRRTHGFAENVTNDSYLSDAGFVALNTFRNNVYWNNSPGSYPNIHITFGANAIPEPSTLGFTGLLLAAAALARARNRSGSKARAEQDKAA